MKPKLSLDDLYALERLREGRIIPNTDEAVFVVSRSDGVVDSFDVRVVSLSGGKVRKICEGLPLCAGLRPSPDGQSIAFMGSNGGAPQIMRASTNGIWEPRAVTDIKHGVSSPPVWSPDGKWLAFTAIGEERLAKGPFDPARSRSVHYKLDGGVGLTERRSQDLFIVSEDGREQRRLTNGPRFYSQPSWSPDSQSICFMAQLDPEDIEFRTAIGVVTIYGVITWCLDGIEDYVTGAPCFAGDGKSLLFPCKPPGRPLGTQARLYKIGLDRPGVIEARTEALSIEQGGHVSRGVLLPLGVGSLLARQPIAPSGLDAAFCVVELEGRCVIHRIALSGSEQCLPVTPKTTGAFLLDATDTHVLWAGSDYNVPPDVWVSNQDGDNPTRLTFLNDEFLATRALPKVTEVRLDLKDRPPVHGWILAPADAEGPVPAVLEIHGGPHAAWGNAFNLWAHALVGTGIAVMLPNPRGSSGYGDAFGAAIQGQWGDPDGADLLAFVDEAVRLGVADADKLGIGGVSGGGHLTAWLIGQSNRFKAAIPEQMISNFISFYGQSDLGRLLVLGEFGVTPQNGFDRLWHYSPLAHAHKVTTPTLIIQCELDVRCPMGEAEQYFRALKDAGCMAEFMRVPGSFHGGPQAAGITALARVRDHAALEWYQRFLLT